MTRILLVRHAHHHAVGKYLAGTRPGLHLSDAGRAQLRDLVAKLHDVPLSAVVSSPLERTRETAEPIARDHGLEIEIEPGVLEFEVGEWTGEAFAALESNPEWRRFNSVRSVTRAPAGELMLEVQRRVVIALLGLRERFPNGVVAVVSHGDAIRSALLYFLGMPIDFLHRLEVSPARVSIVDLTDDSIRVMQVNGDTVPQAF
jgi:broad specificity phosphatase PhoE